jgi:hypothetical protein
MKVPDEVFSQLGHYVYAYVDPATECIFYIGKGVGGRAVSHLAAPEHKEISCRIAKIRDSGREPRIDIIRAGLNADQAALVEASCIDLLGLESLANKVRGFHRDSIGRVSLADLIASQAAKPVEITERGILIIINRLFRSGMSEHELYEATRGVWKIGVKREQATHAFAVFRGVIRGVFKIEYWEPANPSSYSTRIIDPTRIADRWQFVGAQDADLASKYINGSVRHLMPPNAQNPIRYLF